MGVGLVNEMLESCFLPLRHALEDSRNNSLAPDQVRDLITADEVVLAALEGVHKNFKELLRTGIEGRALAIKLNDQAERVTRSLAMHAQVRDVATAAMVPPKLKATFLETLDEMIRRTEKIGAEVAGLERWQANGPPKVDPTKLGGTESGPSAASFESVEDVFDRVASRRDS